MRIFKERIKKLFHYRNTLWDMSLIQLKAKYAGSKLGIWWAVVTPLILAVCINFIFTRAFKVDIPNYTLLLLSGFIPWLFFNASLSEATNSFMTSSSVAKQTIFPRELIPLSSVLSNFLNFLIGFIFLLPIFILFNFYLLHVIMMLIFVIVLHFLFIAGLGLLLACVNVFFRDLNYFLSIGFMFWFWITPIFYSLDMIPFPFRWVCLLNPMTYYVLSYKQILFDARSPSFLTFLILFSLSLGFFVIGYLFFLKKEAALLKKI